MLLGSVTYAQDFDFGCIDYEALRLERQQEIIDLSIPDFVKVFSREKGSQDEIVMQDDTGLDLLAEQTLGLGRLEYILQVNWDASIATGGTWPNEVLRVKGLIEAELANHNADTAITNELATIYSHTDAPPTQFINGSVVLAAAQAVASTNSAWESFFPKLNYGGFEFDYLSANTPASITLKNGDNIVSPSGLNLSSHDSQQFTDFVFKVIQKIWHLNNPSYQTTLDLIANRKAQIQLLAADYDYITINHVDRIRNSSGVDGFEINNTFTYLSPDYQNGAFYIQDLEDIKWGDMKQAISDKVDDLVRIANLPLIPTGLTSEQYNAANTAATNNNRHDFIRDLAITGVVNVSALLFNDDGEFFTFSSPNGAHASISVNSGRFGQATIGELTERPFRDFYLFCILAVYQIQYPDAPALNAAEALDHIFSSTTEPGYLIDSLGDQAEARANGSRKSLFTDLESRGNLDISASEQTVTVTNSDDSSQTRSFTISHFEEGTPTLSTLGDQGIKDLYFEVIRAAWNFK